MSVLALIQARMGSSRLPGKMMMPLVSGKGALELMLERVGSATSIQKIVVATSDLEQDDCLSALCKSLNVPCFRGSETDVLDRYYQAVAQYPEFDVVVRLTGDCPLHDPKVIDQVVHAFLDGQADYVSNVDPPTFPDGFDIEVFRRDVLAKAWAAATVPEEREHVTLYIRNNRTLFNLKNVPHSQDQSRVRLTLDTLTDFEVIQFVFQHLYPASPDFGLDDILAFLATHDRL
ncbi:MAG: spore coat polysaccharide biosynthesis protein SpsF [Candidatus Marinamargulisbacteria bacterium]|jgi:spore coat polysaccharide biosynthesis protein SpsF